ncbi:MAG: hypothetical protein IPP15_20730 [Saprospiraceae bacterium]|uniref:Uncharacterized protein n=1 Tax=Candidatus Opimibacter skivensis TaxID=2982028 RepID=A0A9D7T1S4_9BACT|nr:hypothetical protein [Candidatus Opimibacter skivensis]
MKRAHYLIFILFALFLANVTFDRIKGGERSVIWSDCEGYYLYLPGVFIIKDFHKWPSGSMWPYYNEKKEFVDKYSCGVAYFELPFFGIGHLISKLKGQDAKDYFSLIYSKAIAFGGILLSLCGLLLLYKTLLHEDV